ncbi:Uma2 family endonuclease [Nostoc sp. WHI]|uniref:Uma2 family endonuclease n=1 Tax=Nostoc sp. WHI TaxID=2650611 RepID=UPI001E3F699C|nr:Uma2 family endonuclease [Nostoc sp. WHI]
MLNLIKCILGKEGFDFEIDPPPDLVLEVDLTSNTKAEDYQASAAGELWIYRRSNLQIYHFVSMKVSEVVDIRKSYKPNLEGDIPAIVIEFLSDTEGGEYSVKRTYPPGKWFFYEQILQIPIYIIFNPDGGLLEFYQLENERYELKQPDENGCHWVELMSLFLGTWQGTKEARSGYWLRWWDTAGNLLPWAVEQIAQERQQKERLIAYLQSQGVDPNNLPYKYWVVLMRFVWIKRSHLLF